MKLSNIMIFAAGAAIGSAVTYKILKNKYEQDLLDILNDSYEVPFDSENEWEDYDEEDEVEEEPVHKPSVTEYAAIIKDEEYSNKEGVVTPMADKEAPYVITPEEFGEFDDYNKVSICYYADDIYAYEEDDEVVEDPDAIIGADIADHFGEFEDNAVFVRNDSLKTDYEIVRDERTYEEVCG